MKDKDFEDLGISEMTERGRIMYNVKQAKKVSTLPHSIAYAQRLTPASPASPPFSLGLG